MPPSIRCTKKRGEWAELQFMAKAAGLGLTVSKPWGESSRYDFVVESGGRLLRVQVKSTMHRVSGSFICHLSPNNRAYRLRYGGSFHTYTPKEIDFIAIYIIPRDIWYIIPARIALRPVANIWLTPSSLNHKYKRFQEAWHLLKDSMK